MKYNPHLPPDWKPVHGTEYRDEYSFVIRPGTKEVIKRMLKAMSRTEKAQ